MKVDFLIPMQDTLNANQHLHHQPKAKKVKALRELAASEAEGLVFPDPCRLVVHLGFPDKKRRDLGNYFPTIKALTDGLVDAGCIPDDSWDHMIGPDFRHIDYSHKGHLYVCLEIMPVVG